jgi:hypothetical protein
MKKIGIYPGTFQPAAKSHYEVYKKLKSMIGGETFVATTDREPVPEAPLNFGDKEQIWVRHGVPASHIIKVQTLPIDGSEWKPQEIFHKFPSKQTIAVLVLNEREAGLFSKRKGKVNKSSTGLSNKTRQELNEIYEELSPVKQDGEVWLDSRGKPSYFQPYKTNENSLKPFEEHIYIVIMDDTKIQGQPVSTANIRSVLGSEKYDDRKKKTFFRFVFGWFDVGLYQLMIYKFRNAHQAAYEPANNLQETVYSILKELVDEDYSTTINTPDSSTNMTNMATTIGQEDPAAQAKQVAQNRINLVQQKKELEAKDKQDKQQRDNYSTTVKNYDQFQKKNNRDALDNINSQLSKVSSPTAPTTPI